MSKIFLLKILFVLLLLNPNLFGQKSKTPDSLAIQTKEVESIFKDALKNPLQPVETTSPRSTFHNFLENIYKSHKILMLAYSEDQQTQGLFTPDSIKLKAKDAEEFFQRAVRCLNLNDIPEAIRENVGKRQALKLKDILDRIDLPPLDKIPNEAELEIEGDEGTVKKLTRWRIPHTDIVIAKVEEGPRRNEYLFTPETIKRLDEFYNNVEDLPYKISSYSTPGFYNFFITTPGKFLPPKWADWLPEWSKVFFLEQTIWKWLFFLIYILISAVILITLYRLFNPWDTTLKPLKRDLRRISYVFLIILLLIGLDLFDRDSINMTGVAKIIITIPGVALFWLLLAVLILMIFKILAEIIVSSPKINPVDIQASYIRAIFTVIGFLVAMIIFIFGLSRVGVSLAPLLAGVGIGGFAIALAARPTLENIIGSFMIFADKPFKVGQRIKVTDYDGVVEEIGLRSTKIRLLNGNLTSIPNEKMVTLEIENIGRRPYIRRTFDICITYDTPPEKIIQAVKILNDILCVPKDYEQKNGDSNLVTPENKPHPNETINKPDFPPRIYFSNFNADSLNLYISYWYHPPEWWEYNEHAHWINLQIKERFIAEGIKFAFPTQTIHLADNINENKNDTNIERTN